MIRDRVLSIAALCAVTTLSGAALAGPTITDRSYWPNEARASGQSGIAQKQSADRPAPAKATGARAEHPAPVVNSGQQRCRYLGGPRAR